MSNPQLTDIIRQHLDAGLEAIPAGRLYQLRSARQHALERHGHTAARKPFGAGWLRPALATAALALAVGLTVTYMDGQNQINEMAALDSALLTDDLPPKAFTDPGFRAWLEESSEG